MVKPIPDRGEENRFRVGGVGNLAGSSIIEMMEGKGRLIGEVIGKPRYGEIGEEGRILP